MALTLCKTQSSLFWCFAVVSFQFTQDRFFFMQKQVAKLASRLFYCYGLYCVTITWLQIFKGSLQAAVEGVLLHVTDRKHLGE